MGEVGVTERSSREGLLAALKLGRRGHLGAARISQYSNEQYSNECLNRAMTIALLRPDEVSR
jgi:hypothetical protein